MDRGTELFTEPISPVVFHKMSTAYQKLHFNTPRVNQVHDEDIIAGVNRYTVLKSSDR